MQKDLQKRDNCNQSENHGDGWREPVENVTIEIKYTEERAEKAEQEELITGGWKQQEGAKEGTNNSWKGEQVHRVGWKNKRSKRENLNLN